jgi:hypothetical protein
MSKTGKRATTKPPRFRVGDPVKISYTLYTAHGVITEDRGGLDVDGGRLYGVRFVLDPREEPRYLELGEYELEPDTQASNGKD